MGQTDSTATAVSDQTAEPEETEAEKKKHARVSDFKAYAGVTLSDIIINDSKYESTGSAGYNLGGSYRRGRLFYWEVGVRFNGSSIALDESNFSSEETLNMRQLDFPVSLGINVLSPLRRVVGLRAFVGGVPGVLLDVSNNKFDLTIDDFNSGQFMGQIGVGVDVLFLFVEIGYNQGVTDLLEDVDSKLAQGYFNLGVRF
ncbi:outer membrane beta-barrel protein [Cryomorphaceae bacterium 1068]|nr:outer membrane beta-barrel protein [Cryomorphaceae bacterium 1068]